MNQYLKIFLFVIIFHFSEQKFRNQENSTIFRNISKQSNVLIKEILNQTAAYGIIAQMQFINISKIYNQNKGFANIYTKRKMKYDDYFRAGSITKTFTSAAILKLISKQKINMNDTLHYWLPNCQISYAKQITIFDLLHHTSNINEYLDYIFSTGYFAHYFSPQQLIKIATNKILNPIQYPPNGTFVYTNTNYLILAVIIEKATNQSYHSYIQTNFIDKYGLKNTYFPINTTKLRKPYSHAYMNLSAPYNQIVDFASLNPSMLFGCGDIVSTVEDLGKWAKALYVDQVVLDKQDMKNLFSFVDSDWNYLIKQSNESQIYMKMKYGAGVEKVYFVEQFFNNSCVKNIFSMIGHNGIIGGYLSNMYVEETTQTVLSMFENNYEFSPIVVSAEFLSIAINQYSQDKQKKNFF